MVRYLLIFSFLVAGIISATAQSLSGKVTDKDTGEPIIYGNVAAYSNGSLIIGTQTDFNGNYTLSSIDPGTYDITFSYVGYTELKIEGVLVKGGIDLNLDGNLTEGYTLIQAEVITYRNPLVDPDKTTIVRVFTDKDIENAPVKTINGIASLVAGVSTSGDDLTFRGSRPDGTFYYIDGIRVNGNLIPQSEIGQLEVITGGIGAKYGDVTGGIISITTKGPAGKLGGGFDLETSNLFDFYNYNLASAYVGGPILTKNKGTDREKTLLGFRLSGQYRYQLDDDPPATDIFRIKEDVLAELEANPVLRATTIEGNTQQINKAEYLTNDDVNVLDYQPYEDNRRYDLTAKLDARLGDGIDVTFTGTYANEKDYFTPGESNRTGANWRVLNAHNNPFDTDTRYRGNFRFRHRLGGSDESSLSDREKVKKTNIIQNASYTLQFGLEQNDYELADKHHGTNFFNYGHVGSFDFTSTPQFTRVDTNGDGIPDKLAHTGYDNSAYELGSFSAAETNPILANYNLNFNEDGVPYESFPAINGQTTDIVNEAFNYHTNVGTVFNLYRKRDRQNLTVQASAGFDLLPKGLERAKHSIEFGFLYEQRTERLYEMTPRDLWTVMRQLSNQQLAGVDTFNVIGDTLLIDNGELVQLNIYGQGTDDVATSSFFNTVRSANGIAGNQAVNIDAMSPDQFSLDMFSAAELTTVNDLGLNYYGYDYLGNDFNGTFDDFFTTKDAKGLRTYPVAPFRPIYTAAYIQDKFKFDKIIIRAGLRLDRFDANTKILKDPYSLYEIVSAADWDSQTGQTRPSTIGEGFKVYTEQEGGEKVKAYRDGDTWYFANGTTANDGAEVFGGKVVNAVFTDENDNIADESFINRINNSFEDYTPQVNVMPRLAFSFPINEDANFFAHYDILVQRPPSNSASSGLDYLNFTSRDISDVNPKNNSNLKPERTIDYEVGFQQKLTQRSALKLSAYYKELRDMIQLRIVQNFSKGLSQYYTYDNLDFGTVKGFSAQYDLRRTGNISLNANYTLQFAKGTGSDVNSSRGLSSRGILRVLYPLSFDERHRLTLSADYRYGSDKEYNGPKLFGNDILANAGLNMQVIAVSGRPYTATTTPEALGGSQTKGSINGSRLPWNNTINLRLDKNFTLVKPQKDKNGVSLNVYFRVSNLLDARNLVEVYSASGSAETDGYLRTSVGQTQIAGQANFIEGLGERSNSFVDSYQWRLLNPNFFSMPRRMYIGARVDF